MIRHYFNGEIWEVSSKFGRKINAIVKLLPTLLKQRTMIREFEIKETHIFVSSVKKMRLIKKVRFKQKFRKLLFFTECVSLEKYLLIINKL